MHLKNPNFSLENFFLFTSIKFVGCNWVIQHHYSGNFASRKRTLMSLKGLHFEQYDGEVYLRYVSNLMSKIH